VTKMFDPFFTTKVSGMGLDFPFPGGSSRNTAVICGRSRQVRVELHLNSPCRRQRAARVS